MYRIDKEHVTSAYTDDIFILAPEEGPILFVLREIGLKNKDSRDDTSSNKGKIGPVISVGDLLRGGPDNGDERDIRAGMASMDVVDTAEDRIRTDDIRKGLMQQITCNSEADKRVVPGPAAGRNRNSERILGGELCELCAINTCASLQPPCVSLVHCWQCTHCQCGKIAEVLLDSWP